MLKLNKEDFCIFNGWLKKIILNFYNIINIKV